jgi:glucosamine--fructose-6-phosphate aminotransferase (isomerizing)
MCGIVGYIGEKRAQDYLIEGLHRLEYRGYDSAGIVTIDDNQPKLYRAKGKVSELDMLVNEHPSAGLIGIGHTRWATHGAPSETNAHPQKSGDIYLVHNGIIENYQELKAELKDHQFVSETDTEVLTALVDSFYDENTSLADAVIQALQLTVGTYGIAVVSSREPNQIVVARSGSPLIIGIGEGETYIASDASALIGHTDQAVYLNDGEVAVCHAGSIDVVDLASKPVSAKVETIEVDMQAIQKQGYDHFLLKEISEQPQTLRSTLNGRVDVVAEMIKLGGLNMSVDELRAIEHVTIIGCGTAYYAGMLASYYLEQIVDGLTIDVAVASEFRYRSFHLPKNTVALIVSQSGETADTLACLHEIKKRGIKTLGIINVVGSTIAREVDGGIYVHAGPEISVASTKAFTSQTAAMIMFGLVVAEAKGASSEVTLPYIQELDKLPEEIEHVIKQYKDTISEIAKKYAAYNHALYFGRDTAYPAALEGALKLKEISYIQAEGYPAGELKHGPIALVDDTFFEVGLLIDNWLYDKTLSSLSEVNARGGHILAITNSQKPIEAETVLSIDTSLNLLSPLVLNVAQQLFAYYIAVARGNDVDQPRNLAKSVTVE